VCEAKRSAPDFASWIEHLSIGHTQSRRMNFARLSWPNAVDLTLLMCATGGLPLVACQEWQAASVLAGRNINKFCYSLDIRRNLRRSEIPSIAIKPTPTTCANKIISPLHGDSCIYLFDVRNRVMALKV
jgi:hypothetical protein